LWGQLIERCFVLLLVLRIPWTKICTERFPILCVVSQGVEFMVAHDGQGFPLFDHGPNDFKHLPNLWPPVYEIAEEDHLAFGMPVRSVGLFVTEEFEELHQFIGMAVNVADQVVHALACLEYSPA
jgi:hypothetical protein